MAIDTGSLREIGLTDSEIKAYLALLELGSTTTGPLVDQAKVASSKIYEVLDKLIQKGLASYIIKAGTKYFEAADPKRILDYLNEKETKLKQQKENINSILPELELKKTLSKYKSEAQVFKGIKGGETAFKQLLSFMKKGDEWLAFVIAHSNKKYFNVVSRIHDERAKRGFKARLIFNEKLKNEAERERNIPHTKIKFVSETLQMPTIINVAGDTTLINMMTEEITVFLIENKAVADSFRAQFEKMWQQDTTVTKGMDALKNALYSHLDSLDPNDTYRVLGAGFGREGYRNQYVEFFREFHKKRLKMGLHANLLFQPGHEDTLRKYGKELYKEAELKFLPYKTESPVAIFPYKDRTIMTIQEKEPTVITINNKIVTESFEKYFDTMWAQDTRIVKGVDAIQDIFEDMLPYGQVDWIGARGYFVDIRPKYIDDWEKRAKKAGFKIRNIVDPGVRGHRITQFDFAETKYTLPKEFTDLSVFWIYGNKVGMSNWVEDEPMAMIIENKNVHDMYKKQFELLWNQKSSTYEGESGVKAVFDDMLHFKDVYFIGGNDGIKKYFPGYWREHDKKRVAKGVFWHDLLDTHRMAQLFDRAKADKIPYYEFKLLPEELSSPHVIAIYGNKIANIIWRENTIITVIEDEEITEGYKKYFNYLWKTL